MIEGPVSGDLLRSLRPPAQDHPQPLSRTELEPRGDAASGPGREAHPFVDRQGQPLAALALGHQPFAGQLDARLAAPVVEARVEDHLHLHGTLADLDHAMELADP